MPRQAIKSTDPRKPLIMAAIKRKANCRKVTCVAYEPDTNTFSGVAMWPNPEGFTPGLPPGNVHVTTGECHFPSQALLDALEAFRKSEPGTQAEDQARTQALDLAMEEGFDPTTFGALLKSLS